MSTLQNKIVTKHGKIHKRSLKGKSLKKKHHAAENKIVDKPSMNDIEKLIFEKGLRITQLVAVKKQDSLIVFLNNTKNISVRLSSFTRLKKATQQQLDGWKLISQGIGIGWPEIDEDISLKGLIEQLIRENTLRLVGDYTYAMAA